MDLGLGVVVRLQRGRLRRTCPRSARSRARAAAAGRRRSCRMRRRRGRASSPGSATCRPSVLNAAFWSGLPTSRRNSEVGSVNTSPLTSSGCCGRAGRAPVRRRSARRTPTASEDAAAAISLTTSSTSDCTVCGCVTGVDRSASVGSGVRPVVGADPRRLRATKRLRRAPDSGADFGLLDQVIRRRTDRVVRRDRGVPRLGVAALAGDDEHRGRSITLAVQVQAAAVADVDQTRATSAPRGRRGEGHGGHDEQDRRAESSRRSTIRRASTKAGRTCSSSGCDGQHLQPRRAGRGVRRIRGDGGQGRRRPATGIPGLTSTPTTSPTSSTPRAPCAAASRCGRGSGRRWRPSPAAT